LAREQSAAFARRLLTECGDEWEDIVRRAWRLAFGRLTRSPEMVRSLQFLKSRTDAPGGRETALAELCLALFNANEFAYVD
jgi:hypothetical protein